MHPEAWQWVEESIALWGQDANRVLDLGGKPDAFGDGTGLRPLFPPSTEYTCVDYQDGDLVDIVADIRTLRLPELWDVVLCTEVLEHTPDWTQVLDTCAAHVHSAGLVVITSACDPREPHSALDGWGGPLQEGEYYGNPDIAAVIGHAESLFIRVAYSTLDRGDLRIRGEGR